MIKTVSFAPPRAHSSRSAASPRKSGGKAASGSSAPQISLSLSFDEPEPIAPAPQKAEKPVKTAKSVAPKIEASPKIEAAKPLKSPDAPIVAPKVEDAAKPALKARKVRAPKDFAAQYGEKIVERAVVPVLEAETPKKRLNKEQRAARRELIKPDEGLLARLARASQVSSIKPKSEPRGKGWKFQCGRCGQTSYFPVPAALCDCGAIAIKD
ncbi:MAG TPA: hypothetical protein VGB45_05065 [Abditibacterium sp.]|jgi:hypothetical protein